MIDQPHPKFLNTRLDPRYLSTPYNVQTNWHVIAGAPSAGKTTLVNQLAELGFQTAPEPARLYLDGEIAKGRKIQEIRKEHRKLQHIFFDLQMNLESKLNPADFLIMDRGIPDQFTYCRIAGVNPNKFLKDSFYFRYAAVFILDPLPFESDGYRDPEADRVDYFDTWITRDYHALGYETIRIPVLPPEERLAFVLKELNASGHSTP
jgi:predicted ATPase